MQRRRNGLMFLRESAARRGPAAVTSCTSSFCSTRSCICLPTGDLRQQGAMTPWATGKPRTACRWQDRAHHFFFPDARAPTSVTVVSPVKRVYIPERKRQASGRSALPPWFDKLSGEVVCSCSFEAITSRSLRPLALFSRPPGLGTPRLWISAHLDRNDLVPSEGDVLTASGVFDHQVMLSILAGIFHDNRSCALMRTAQAGIPLEDWRWNGDA